jgi:AcrR family transcriptional regulator
VSTGYAVGVAAPGKRTRSPARPSARPAVGGRTRVVTQRAPTRTLSRAAIVAAALRIIDAEGLDAATMRRVAAELDTGPASLYAHVADKEEMVAAVLDHVVLEVEIPDPIDPKRWQQQLKAMLISMRDAYQRHNDLARAGLGSIPVGPNALVVVDAVLGVMLAGGVSKKVASFAADLLGLYVTSTVFEQSMGHFADHDGKAEYHDQVHQLFRSLSADTHPHIASMAAELTEGDGDERFEFGLDLIIRGIASTRS